VVNVPPAAATEVQRQPRKPGPAEVRKHELCHIPCPPWCEVCVAAKGKGKDNHHKSVDKGSLDEAICLPKLQLDLMLARASGEFVEKPMTKTIILTVAPRECRSVATTELISKDHWYAVAFVKRFIGRYDDVDLKTGNERVTKGIGERVKVLRQPQKTMLRTSGLYAREDMGAVERTHAAVHGQIREMREQSERDNGSNKSATTGYNRVHPPTTPPLGPRSAAQIVDFGPPPGPNFKHYIDTEKGLFGFSIFGSETVDCGGLRSPKVLQIPSKMVGASSPTISAGF
jgi:hypothetical protein